MEKTLFLKGGIIMMNLTDVVRKAIFDFARKHNKETKKEAIDRLKKEGYGDLWIVDSHITYVKILASTAVWSIFNSEAEAKKWITECIAFYSDSTRFIIDLQMAHI